MSSHAPCARPMSRRERWSRRAAGLAVVAAVAGARSSGSDDVPATTLDRSPPSTLAPGLGGPQVELEPGSNLPPDDTPSDPGSDDTDMSPATEGAATTGG